MSTGPFVEKRPLAYRKIREAARDGESSDFVWGPPAQTCEACGAMGLPASMAFCGNCRERLSGD